MTVKETVFLSAKDSQVLIASWKPGAHWGGLRQPEESVNREKRSKWSGAIFVIRGTGKNVIHSLIIKISAPQCTRSFLPPLIKAPEQQGPELASSCPTCSNADTHTDMANSNKLTVQISSILKGEPVSYFPIENCGFFLIKKCFLMWKTPNKRTSWCIAAD